MKTRKEEGNMPGLDAFVAGDRWLYRPSMKDPGVQVEVTNVRSGPPARVEIVLVDRRDAPSILVPTSQLKCPWRDRDAFLVSEAAWQGLVTTPDDLEWQAVVDVFQVLVGDAVTVNWGKSKRGTLTIVDAGRLDRALEGELGLVVARAPHIVDSSGTSYGWSTAVGLARRAAELNADRVLAHVRVIEAETRRVAVRRPGIAADGRFVTVQTQDVAFQDEFMRPLARLLRDWCGEAGEIADERHLLQEENARLSRLLVDSLARLADAGDEQASWVTYELAFPGATRLEWRAAVSYALDRS